MRAIGGPSARLARWLNAMENGVFAALRRVDEIEVCAADAERETAPLSGKTPPMLRDPFTSLPLGAGGGETDGRASGKRVSPAADAAFALFSGGGAAWVGDRGGDAAEQLGSGTRLAAEGSPVPMEAIGMLPNVSRTLEARAAATFKAEAPAVDLRLYWASIPALVARLHRAEIDFLAGRLLALDYVPGVRFEHLSFEPLIFVTTPTSPFAARFATAQIDDIRAGLVIVPIPGTIIRTELDRFLVARGYGPFPNVIETVSFEFTRSFLEQAEAVACVPIGAVRNELAQGSLLRLGIKRGANGIGRHDLCQPPGPEAALLRDHIRRAAVAFV